MKKNDSIHLNFNLILSSIGFFFGGILRIIGDKFKTMKMISFINFNLIFQD